VRRLTAQPDEAAPRVQDAHSHLPGAKCEAFERYLEVVARSVLL